MRQGLIGATAIMMTTFVASRFLGYLRLSVIGAKFGLSPELDAYWAANVLPESLFNLVVAGTITSAFIPVFTGYLARERETEGWHVASSVMNAVLLLLVLASAGLALAAPLFMPYLAAGFRDDPALLELAVNLTRIMLLSPIFMGLSSLMTGILNVYRQFLSGAVAPVVYNATIILFVVFLEPFLGIYALAWGVVTGALMMWLVQIPELAFRRTRYSFALDLPHPGVIEVARLTAPRALAQGSAFFAIPAVNTALASGLAAGSLSALNFAFALMLLPLGVFSMAISSAIFPSLSHFAALGQEQRLRQSVAQAIRLILFLTLPAAIAMMVLRRPIVHLLFQYEEFGDAAREATAAAFLFYAIGLAGHAVVQILTRAFYAAKDTRTPLLTTLLSILANVVLAFVLVGWVVRGSALGIEGLALANSVATLGEAALLFALLRARLRLPVLAIGFSTLRQLAAALLMGISIFVFVYLTNVTVRLEVSKLGLALQLLSAFAVAGVSYAVVCWLLRVEEVRLVLSFFRGRAPAATVVIEPPR
jgi:putative peptidoglycan lipid II flippase